MFTANDEGIFGGASTCARKTPKAGQSA